MTHISGETIHQEDGYIADTIGQLIESGIDALHYLHWHYQPGAGSNPGLIQLNFAQDGREDQWHIALPPVRRLDTAAVATQIILCYEENTHEQQQL